MANPDTLGVGLYSMVEAAKLLNTPRRTLSRWVEGYVCQLRSGARSYAPLIVRDDESSLSFGDLVELLYVRGFRNAGVDLDEIRDTAAMFRQEWNLQYPLATSRFATDGRRLLLLRGGDWQHALTGQFQAFFDSVGRQLRHVGDFASEWRPLGPERSVVLHPDRSFGKPIDDTSGTHTHVLARALETEPDAAKIAWWYGTTTASVLDAVEFERSLRAGSKDGNVLLR